MKTKHILFWSNYNPETDLDLETWRNRPLQLSPFHTLTLESHVIAKNDTVLYTYQNIDLSIVHEGITLLDANLLYKSEEAFSALQRGHSIALIADTVRILSACFNRGIVLDMDAVILRPFPKVDTFYSSMPAKMTGGFAPKWGDAHPPIMIHNNSWDGKALSCFPLKISENTRVNFMYLAYQIKVALSEPVKKTSKAWNFILWTVKDIIKTDPNGLVLPPNFNCPVPAWLRSGKCYSLEYPNRFDGKTELFGHTMPRSEYILGRSYIVQHFFESAFSDSSSVDSMFWRKLHPESLLGMEAEYLLGSNWRIILIDLQESLAISEVTEPEQDLFS